MITCHVESSHKQIRKVGIHKPTCSKCEQPLEAHRHGKFCYCLKCHAEYMRLNRPKHSDLPEHARMKANARAYAHVYVKRGVIKREQCQVCGADAQMHHTDYSKPKQVLWFCRKHHLELHNAKVLE